MIVAGTTEQRTYGLSGLRMPATGEVRRRTRGWVLGSVTFQTGSTGTAVVELFSDNPDYGAQYHDLRLLPTP